jgi:hypothetical protein
MEHQTCIIGYLVQPSQTLSKDNTSGLHSDVISLLSSLTYHPKFVSRVTLDLRYIAKNDKTLVAKGLDIVLLVRIDFEEQVTASKAEELVEQFRGSFSDLLSLHLVQYEFEIVPLNKSEVNKYLSPFDIHDIVEITRRITSTRPFAWTKFEGQSPMTRVVDMLLRHEGQCLLSILLHPHILTDEETRQLEVFGYQNPILPGRKEDDLLDTIINFDQIKRSLQSVFKMTIKLASDEPISQYLVNLVGSEISGQRDFYYFGHPDRGDLEGEAIALSNLLHTSALKKVMTGDIPPILLDLVYLFRPDEAVRAFRFPTQRISVAQEKGFQTYPAPVRFLPAKGILVGESTHPSYKGKLPVYIAAEDRGRHIYIIGKTGTGKSYLMLNMIEQDLQDKGICVIDPHGDLVEAVFASIPENRINDVYYFNPADQDYVLGLNFLETSTNADESERDYVVQEVISMLLRYVEYNYEMFGPIAQQWTRFGVMTLMELDPTGTLTDMPRLFSDSSYRRLALSQVKDPIIKQWWKNEFDTKSDYQRNEILGYFTSKFTPMVTAPQIRNVIGQSKSVLDFESIMNDQKILLVNLSSGLLGKSNSHFLGSLFVSRLLWTALSRAKDPAASRKQFYLYVDEFQNFITDSFESILSEARKYGLSLTIAHQHLEQLRSIGRLGNKVERAIFGNVGTMVSFRLGSDAGFIAGELGRPAKDSDLRNLANRHAVLTLQVEGIPSMPFTMKTVDWQKPTEAMILKGNKIREAARKRGRPVAEVASEIRQRFENKVETPPINLR